MDHSGELQHSESQQSEHQQQVPSQCEQRHSHRSSHWHGAEMFGVHFLLRRVVKGMDNREKRPLVSGHVVVFGRQGHVLSPGLHEFGNSWGAATCTARSSERINSTITMVQFTILFQRLFANFSPNTSRSFNNSCRKMIAEGSISPASTCTLKMISCRGARGINTNPAAA